MNGFIYENQEMRRVWDQVQGRLLPGLSNDGGPPLSNAVRAYREIPEPGKTGLRLASVGTHRRSAHEGGGMPEMSWENRLTRQVTQRDALDALSL